jgi:hypothetical protein
MHPKFSPADIVKIFKGITAKKLFEMHPELSNRHKITSATFPFLDRKV